MNIEGILLSIQQQQIETQFNRDESTDKFRDEVEKIRNEQLQHFSQLFNEQKAKLDEAYTIRDLHKQREQLLVQKIEEEDQDFEKTRLNVPHVDSDAFDNIVLDNKSVDTHDLFLTQSIGVDTSSLKSYESVEIQATPITVQTTSKFVQVSKKTHNNETQADFKLNVFQQGSAEIRGKLNLIDNHFQDFVGQQYLIDLSRFMQIDEQVLSKEATLFLSGLSAVMNGLLIKQEFSQKDTQEILKYVELNVSAVQFGLCEVYSQIEKGKIGRKQLQMALRQNEMEMTRLKIQARLNHMYTRELLKSQQNNYEGKGKIADNCRIQKNQQCEFILNNVSNCRQVLIESSEQPQSSPSRGKSQVNSKIDLECNNEYVSNQQIVDMFSYRDLMKCPSKKESQEFPFEQQGHHQISTNTQLPGHLLSSKEKSLNNLQNQPDICNEESDSESDDYLSEIINETTNTAKEQKIISKEESKRSSIELDHLKKGINDTSDIPVIRVQSNSKQAQKQSAEVSAIPSLTFLCLPNKEEQKNRSRSRSSVMTQIAESIKAENQCSPSNMISRPSWRQKSVSVMTPCGQGNEMIASRLLRDLGIIKQVDNIFNRLRVSRKAGKTTKQATLIIERLIREQQQQELMSKDLGKGGGGVEETRRILYLREKKIPGLLKIFSQILTELFKFIQKNKTLRIPHFHVFTFEYFLKIYGQNEATEKRYWKILKACQETRLIDKRIRLYWQLLIGEIDYIDYKFLLELLEKIDDTDQFRVGVSKILSEISHCYISWQKVYELFVGYFGQTVEGSQLYEYEKELCSKKIKLSQGSRVCIDLIDTIELLMRIYKTHIKIRSTGSFAELYQAVDCYGFNFVTFEQFQNVVNVFGNSGDSLLTNQELLSVFFDEADLVLDRNRGEILVPELFQEFSDFVPLRNPSKLGKESSSAVPANTTGKLHPRTSADSFNLFIPQEYKTQKIMIKQHLAMLKIDEHAIYGISLLRFSQICIDNNILSSSKQIEFLAEFPENQHSLSSRELAENQIEDIQQRLMKAQHYNLQTHLQIRLIQKYFQQLNQDEKTHQTEELFFQGGQIKSQKQAEFALRILEITSKSIYLQALIEIDLLPSAFRDLQGKFTECIRLRNILKNK